jgi:hypothetical protein
MAAFGAQVRLLVGIPMTAQRGSELRGSLIGEEQAAAVDLDHLGGAGDGVAQPVRPLADEGGVAGAPDDEGRDL